MCYSPKLHGNWLVAFTSWEVFCFFSLHAGVGVSPSWASQSRGTLAVVERLLSWIYISWEVFFFFSLSAAAEFFPRSASQWRGTLALVERLLSWIFIFLIFFLDSLLGFLFLFTDTLCMSRGITILLKATDFPNNFDVKITLRIPRRSYDLCMLSPMCLKQNKTVNHSKINEMVLNVKAVL